MSTDKLFELEQRLVMMQTQLDGKAVELARVQSDLREIKQQQNRRPPLHWLPLFGGLSAVALALVLILSPQSRAQNPTINTVLKAPILIQNASGTTIMEIADRPKHHGITLYNTAGGEVAYLGVSTEQKGIFQLEGQDGKLFADVSEDGFKFFGKSAAAVAFLGADNAGNGALQLKNAADGVVVDAGVLGAATGYVQVYPRSGKSPFPTPNYLKGGK